MDASSVELDCELNQHFPRPGGRVVNHGGHLYRFTQDDEPRYGMPVFAFEMLELSKTEDGNRGYLA